MQKQDILINARFMSGKVSSVRTVAEQLSIALFKVAEQRGQADRFRLVGPPSLEPQMAAFGLPYLVHGTRSGVRWEQMELPKISRTATIVGFFNSVPIFGRGYVTMLHDAQVFLSPHSYRLAIRLWRRLLSRAAGLGRRQILTVSEFSKSELVDLRIAPADRVHVIHNGVGHLRACAPDTDSLARLGLVGRPFFVGLATLLPHKNVKVLMQAFADPRLAGAQLVLTGKATRDDFEAAGISVPSNVSFPGFVDEGTLRSLYEQSVAVCTPSLTEGFGLPPLEAMTLGSTAIVAPCAALPEVCGDAAIYADAHSPQAWADAMNRLLEDPAVRADFVAKGQQNVKAFTWEKSAERLFDLIA